MYRFKFLWRGELKFPVRHICRSASCAIIFTLIAFVFILIAPVAYAQDAFEPITEGEAPAVNPHTANEQALRLGEGDGGAVPPASPVSALSIFRVILTLAVVAAAIYGLVFFIKRASRGNVSRDPFLKILASAPLGANKSAYIISVGSRAWLVGAAEHGVSLISEIDDKDILNAMLLEDSRKIAETPAGPLPNFKGLLRKLGVPVDGAPGPDKIRKRRERLSGL